MWLKRNPKRETESLLIAAQNKVIRINHLKARIEEMQQNSRCRLCADRDKTINHIISEYSKIYYFAVSQDHKTRHDCVGKAIHWESVYTQSRIPPGERNAKTSIGF